MQARLHALSNRSLLSRAKARVSRLYHEHRLERVAWWVLILALSPYLLPRLWMGRIRRGHCSGPRRILVLHLGGIGDTLMMTPAVRLLKQRFPDAVIDLAMAHQYVKEAFEGHPYFREIIPMQQFIRGYVSFRQVSSKMMGVLKALYYFPLLFLRLALRQYDVAIVYALSSETKHLGGALVYAAGVPFRVGFGENRHDFLHHLLRVNHQTQHRIDLYFRPLQLLGISLQEDVKHSYVFPLSQEERAWAMRYLERVEFLRRPLMAMHPGGANLAVPRRWPGEHFLEVAQWFVETTEGTVLLTGGPDDGECCDLIASALGEHVVNTCGRFSIRQTAAILAHCDLCVTNDTSMLHLAAAVSVPNTVAVFGPSDPRLVVPTGHNVRYVQANLPCVPCAGSVINSNTRECWRDTKGECLRAVKPAQVIRALEETLDGDRLKHDKTAALGHNLTGPPV